MKKAALGLSTANEDFRLQSAGADLDARNKQLLAERQRAVVVEARRQVDALTLRAPFDGQVGQVQVPQGTSVVANGAVLSVVDLSQFEVEIKVPESFARDLGIGMAAQLGGVRGAIAGRDLGGVPGSGQWRSHRARALQRRSSLLACARTSVCRCAC